MRSGPTYAPFDSGRMGTWHESRALVTRAHAAW